MQASDWPFLVRRGRRVIMPISASPEFWGILSGYAMRNLRKSVATEARGWMFVATKEQGIVCSCT